MLANIFMYKNAIDAPDLRVSKRIILLVLELKIIAK